MLAHGVGGIADLPLPLWLVAYAVAFALLIAFVTLRIVWTRPRLAGAARGRRVPDGVDTVVGVLRVLAQVSVLVLYVVVVAAAWFGVASVARNLAWTAVFIAFWVGVPIVSAVLGDVWRRANPLWLIAAGLDRVAGRDPEASIATGVWATHWPAVAGLASFLWLELAYHEPDSIAALGVFLGVYSGAVLVGAAVFGAGWVRTGDGFAVVFSLIAALAPLHRDGDGRLRLRWPGAGLSQVTPGAGTLAVVLVLLGGTTFDGFSQTDLWQDVLGSRRGWDATAFDTVGLVLVVATVAVLFLVACRVAGTIAGDDVDDPVEQARRWSPVLIPVVLAYTIAHYVSLVVFEGQSFVALLSDPFGEGWDLFGTADQLIDYQAVSPNTVAWIQVGAILVGHVGAVVASHDRALERYPERVAVRSQYPMLGVLVVYAVAAVVLLLNT